MSLFQVTKKQVIENYELRTMTGDIVSFTPSYSQLLPDPFSDLNVTVNIEATGGNGTPDNPNPIVGYSSANITRCGENLYNDNFSDYRRPYDYLIFNVPLEIGKAYTFSATLKAGGTAVTGCVVGIAGSGERYSEFSGIAIAVNTAGTASTQTIIASSVYTSPKLAIYCADEAQFNSLFENYDIMLVEGTDTTYHPYTGNTYTIAFGQTVYGGVLDVTRGKLHVTHELNNDLSALTWTQSAQGFFIASLPDVKYATSGSQVPDLKCSALKTVSPSSVYGLTDNSISTANGGAYLWAYNSGCADASAFTTLMDSVQLVYELATPFDIDLTPEVISAIVGENNVFADCGETTVTCLI